MSVPETLRKFFEKVYYYSIHLLAIKTPNVLYFVMVNYGLLSQMRIWEKYTFPERARERFLFGVRVRICGLQVKGKGRTESVPSFGDNVRVCELKF